MIDINKENLKKHLDSNGKLISSDDMPEDLKAAIDYLNSRNIDFSKTDIIDDEEEDDDEEYEDEEFSDEIGEDEEDMDFVEETNSSNDSSIDDLNSIF